MRSEYKITIVWKQRQQLSQCCLILKVPNNTYNQETFIVSNATIAWTTGLQKLIIVVQGGPEMWTVNLCLCGSMGNSFQMGLWNLINKRQRLHQIPYVKWEIPAPPPPPPPQTQASRPQQFLELVGKHIFQDGIELGNNCFTGSKGDESDTGNFDNDSDSGCRDDELYTWLS